MNENTQDTTTQSDAFIPSAAGTLMREQREARGFSIEEVAHALKLQPRQVVAMETGDFASLGSLPFARGFVRNYARFIGFDAAPILVGLEQQVPLPKHELGEGDGDGPRVAMPQPGRRRPFTWVLAVSPLILVAVVGAGLYAFGLNLDGLHFGSHGSPEAAKPTTVETAPSMQVVQPAASKAEETVPVAPAPASPPAGQPSVAPMMPGTPPVTAAPTMPAAAPAATSAPTVPTPPAAVPAASKTPAPGSVPAPVAPRMPAPVPAAPVAAAVPVAPAAPAAHHMVLSVASESWVEVKSEGRLVLSRKFTAGQSQSLDGKGPFVVVIGVAKGAKVQYDDKQIDLEPHTKVNVARLTLN